MLVLSRKTNFVGIKWEYAGWRRDENKIAPKGSNENLILDNNQFDTFTFKKYQRNKLV